MTGRRWEGPIVDAHMHVWDPISNQHPWLSQAGRRDDFRYGDYRAIARPYLPPAYLADAAGHDVRATVYVEAEWDPSDPIGETRFVAGLAERHRLPSAIVAQAWLDRPDAGAVLAAQAEFELVRGVRHKPGGPERPEERGRGRRTLMSDERWRSGYELLARHGLSFDLQTPWWNLWEARELARDFPATIIVLDHAGLPGDRSEAALAGWRRAMSELAEAPNVIVKVSGLGERGFPWRVERNRWIVLETIAMFGTSRVMFASNFPVDGLCGSFDTIYSGFKAIAAAFPKEDQQRLFCDTARATYRIEAFPRSTRVPEPSRDLEVTVST